jgi:polyisoprenoid-binding protein YceI
MSGSPEKGFDHGAGCSNGRAIICRAPSHFPPIGGTNGCPVWDFRHYISSIISGKMALGRDSDHEKVQRSEHHHSPASIRQETVRATRGRRVRRWIFGGIVTLVVVSYAAPLVYTHVAAAEPMLALPAASGVAHAGSDPLSLDGPWHTTAGSIAGFRVSTGVLGIEEDVTGRTGQVHGAVAIAGQAVTRASFTVDVASIKISSSARSLMDVTHYPTATFLLTHPITLAGPSIEGTVQHYLATGILSFHGTTRAVSVTLAQERLGNSLYVLTNIPVTFANWHISVPYGVASQGSLEVLLSLSRGAENAA